MLATYYLLCYFILTVNGAIVTINRNKSYWHETNTPTIFDYNLVSNNNRYEAITYAKNEYCRLREIKNFPDLETIEMDNSDNKKVPKLFNLPKLRSISLINNNITYVNNSSLSQVPVQIIVLTSNNISIIEDGSFGNYVTSVHLVCNKLTYISRRWFRNPKTLKYFSITANKVQAIPAKMFKNFTNLKQIILRNNEIKTIGEEAFAGLGKVEKIELSYNHILEIKPSVLAEHDVLNVFKLDIQYNKLSFLHPDLLSKIKTSSLKIKGNPWKCPCRDKILQWYNEVANQGGSHDSSESESFCFKDSLTDLCVYAVDEELLHPLYDVNEYDSTFICNEY